ncbi:anaerobic ribonucleoside-triphosphate reductase activating protein [Epilithonimonas hungarica]|jgi:anaerobic ribonucleoside-triphosphate reductase activating protein|uniref:Anaerobic ribonucleoside-triphosphate reductase activating protein n=1 Tax=Epilithonimonas hungarica TaxID=454006 RepID=A0A1G7J3B9_9FLAO|nr:anaerobic ribonucleoside-triphosphate reductase activating protein [Epilithonimonas hungarica]SDF19009.1 anaerobic ribonucleoside-triphosphate reductase activating protein [Epilithonimonas hungarica]
MLKFIDHNIVFQEVPNEISLAINISNCPLRCKSCHSPQLQEDIGIFLTEDIILNIIEKYDKAITCICFMGGDSEPSEIENLAVFVKSIDPNLKIAWYSGKQKLPKAFQLKYFNFIKLGPYKEKYGGLGSPDTNQSFYKIIDDELIDMTFLFRKERI